MDNNIQKLIDNVESSLAALRSAMGVDKYQDGKAVGNPVQNYDDKDVDLGGQDGGGDGKVKAFAAMMKKKYAGDAE